MGHLSYEDQKKLVMKGLKLLAIVTITEVALALLFNGHIIPSFHKDYMGGFWVTAILVGIYGLAMVGFSLYKAKFIVYNFMHLGSEVKGLRLSVLLPMLLLVWGIIAFFQEGSAWGERRLKIKKMNEQERSAPTGYLEVDDETNTELM